MPIDVSQPTPSVLLHERKKWHLFLLGVQELRGPRKDLIHVLVVLCRAFKVRHVVLNCICLRLIQFLAISKLNLATRTATDGFLGHGAAVALVTLARNERHGRLRLQLPNVLDHIRYFLETASPT